MNSSCHQCTVLQWLIWDSPGLAGSDWLPAFLSQHHTLIHSSFHHSCATGSDQSVLWGWGRAAWWGSQSGACCDPFIQLGWRSWANERWERWFCLESKNFNNKNNKCRNCRVQLQGQEAKTGSWEHNKVPRCSEGRGPVMNMNLEQNLICIRFWTSWEQEPETWPSTG